MPHTCGARGPTTRLATTDPDHDFETFENATTSSRWSSRQEVIEKIPKVYSYFDLYVKLPRDSPAQASTLQDMAAGSVASQNIEVTVPDRLPRARGDERAGMDKPSSDVHPFPSSWAGYAGSRDRLIDDPPATRHYRLSQVSWLGTNPRPCTLR